LILDWKVENPMSPDHKVKLIVNPNADLGRAWHMAGDLRPIVEESGVRV